MPSFFQALLYTLQKVLQTIMNNKKLISTLLLFTVTVGFGWWGLAQLVSSISAPKMDIELVIYSLLLLGCAGYALVSLLILPFRKQP